MNNQNVVNLESEFRPNGTAKELNVGGSAVTAASAFTDATLPDVTHFEISVKTNAVRYTLDGTAPVSSGAGAILGTGIYHRSQFWVSSARFIESAGAAAAVIRFQPGSLRG